MKTHSSTRSRAGFTLVEVLISMSIVATAMSMVLGIFIFGVKTMYKDTQRLATNANLRTFMAQISKETLDASYFYLFAYYTKLDGNINLDADPLIPVLAIDETGTEYDKYVAHGDCLVLVTKTAKFRTTDIRQIRVYYRVTTNQAGVNNEATLRYYETPNTAGAGLGWGEGTAAASNGHPLSGLVAELNAINLNSNPNISGSRQLAPRTKGRAVVPLTTGYTAGDRYPVFSSESPNANATNGYISINVEFINGSTVNNLLSSSSFNYTISPRR